MEHAIFVRRMLLIGACLLITLRYPASADTSLIATGSPCAASPMIVIAETDGPDSGAIRFALFDRLIAGSWNDSVLMAAELPVRGRRIVWKTAPLPEGPYALAIFHDLDGNDELDKNMVGKPVEPYGFSNNSRHPFCPPSIEEATFRFDNAGRTILVKLH